MAKTVFKKGLVLVTGGAGFIGSHLVDALIASGYRVRVLDSLAPPTHNGKLPAWFNKRAEFFKGDVRERGDWLKALKGTSFVFHLAAYMDYHLDFKTYFDTNVSSTALLYEIAVQKKLPIRKIIVTSSQSVYGEGKYFCSRHGAFSPSARPVSRLKKRAWEVACPKDGSRAKPLPQKEDDLHRPETPYGISKLAEEEIAIALGRIYNIPSVALRYSIVHGPRQSFRHFYSGALRVFSVSVLSGKPLLIHEDGNQSRDFINIKDTVSAHIAVLENPRADYQVFNVGSGRRTTIAELAKTVCRVARVKYAPVISGEFRVNTPRHSFMNISKLKRLGWRPRHSLEDNVRSYIDWVRAYPEAGAYLRKTLSALNQQGVVSR